MGDKTKQGGPVSDDVARRLDALIAVLLENLYTRKKKEFNEATAARLLKAVGLTPTEIAKIMGKKSATDISSYLYPKKKKKTEGA